MARRVRVEFPGAFYHVMARGNRHKSKQHSERGCVKICTLTPNFIPQTGNNVMIGGLIITGSGQKNVVVRAIGPSLAQHGITNPLADPTLELHNGNGALIAFNDNWKDTQQAQIQATGLAPTNDKESAIVRTLAPGNYTAIVRGKNNTIGVALVEVYGLNEKAYEER